MNTIKTHIAAIDPLKDEVGIPVRSQPEESARVPSVSDEDVWDAQATAIRRRLTPQQRQVIALVSQGRIASEVAEALGISERTVQHHLSEARHRLGARNTTALVAIALRSGLIR